jgi:lipoyl(octanoyl) transferase
MRVVGLGLMAYREAWKRQEEAHERVVAGGEETLFLVEHPPVVTLGRRADSVRNLRVSEEELAQRGIELVQSDRGGDITYHGPGQLVVYPIVRLAAHGLSVSGYVHRLEAIVIAALDELGIKAYTDPAAVGVWTRDGEVDAKISAIGVRIRKGVSLHGVAVNVTTDIVGYDVIVPCGLEGRAVTSIEKILGKSRTNFATVEKRIIEQFERAFTATENASPRL